MESPSNTPQEAISTEAESNGYLRAHRRYRTDSAVLVTNLTRNTVGLAGFLLDVSTTGMRIETDFSPHVGDQVRVDLPEFTARAEVLHYAGVNGRVEVGLKLAEPLNGQQFLRCLAGCLQPV
jgi:hypothetical protein